MIIDPKLLIFYIAYQLISFYMSGNLAPDGFA